MVKKYEVGLWSGAGYELHIETVEAYSEDHALEVAVANIEEQGLLGLFWDEVEELEHLEEIGEVLYVDATMEGATQPHYIDSTNLRIKEIA